MFNQQLKGISTLATCMAALVSFGAHAEGLYAGAAIGTPDFGNGVNNISGSGSGVSGKVYGGYQLNSNFAIEAGLATLGHINNANGSAYAHGGFVDAVGLLPVGGNFSLLGSLGVAQVNLNTSNGDDKGAGLKLGVGAEYALSRSVALRGEYENYRAAEFGGHPSIGQYTFGVKVGF